MFSCAEIVLWFPLALAHQYFLICANGRLMTLDANRNLLQVLVFVSTILVSYR